MTFIYPIIFHENEKAGLKAIFPILTAAAQEGETLEPAVRDAMEAEYNWIMLELDDEDPELPPVSHPEDLELKEGEFIRNISVKVRLVEGGKNEDQSARRILAGGPRGPFHGASGSGPSEPVFPRPSEKSLRPGAENCGLYL